MTEDRQRSFKNFGKDPQELRRRRTEESVMLRKQRKDEQLVKRRNIDTDELLDVSVEPNLGLVNAEGATAMEECSTSAIEPWQCGEYGAAVSDGLVQQVISDMFHEDEARIFRGVQLAKKMLGGGGNPPIDVFVDAGIVSKCVELLKMKNNPNIQFEVAWVLTNVASGTSAQTQVVIQSGAVPLFIELIQSPHGYIVEQSCWALGNCIGDGPQTRDMIIELGVIPPLIALVRTQTDPKVLKTVSWTLSNICRRKDPPPVPTVTRMCLPAIAHLLTSVDMEIVSSSCWALSYLSDGGNDRIQDVLDSGVVPRLVQLLAIPDDSVITPSLRTLGNIVAGSDSQTQVVLQAGIIPHITSLLQHSKPSIVKEATWTFSNIAAGTPDQISLVMGSGAMPAICNLIQTAEFGVQKAAIWTVANITTGGTVVHIMALCKYGVVQILCNCLPLRDSDTLIIIMDALENILKAARKVGQLERIAFVVEMCGGLNQIEGLQNHENPFVYSKASSIIEQFFSPEDQSLLPEQDASGNLQMDTNPTQGGFDF